jgi:hypothetical protein
MRRRHGFTLVLGVVLLSGCYHATVDTGRVPSGQTIEKEWAHGFVYGLVPPSTVEVAQQCPNGIAKVETQLSFLNQVASALTFGFYTPMAISVQCAAAGVALDGAEMTVPANATLAQGREMMTRAAALSAEERRMIYVQFLAE